MTYSHHQLGVLEAVTTRLLKDELTLDEIIAYFRARQRLEEFMDYVRETPEDVAGGLPLKFSAWLDLQRHAEQTDGADLLRSFHVAECDALHDLGEL